MESQCGNCGNLLPHFFAKNFVKPTYVLLKSIWRNISLVRHSVEIAHSVEKWEILSHWRKISSNQLCSTFFSETIAFTKFLAKKCEREFVQFPHCVALGLSHLKIITWNQFTMEVWSKWWLHQLIWRKICRIISKV